MRTCVLASGSKGNCCYIETNETKILIDMGLNCVNTVKRLNEINVEPNEIDAIFITHTHTDHTEGLKVFTKKYKTKVYLTEKMYDELKDNVQDYEIGQTIGEGNFSSGYRSASDALSGTNSVGLNENSVNATNELKRIFVRGADGSWQNISTPGVKVSDLLAQGYDASDIAFSLANNGTDVAWMPYEQFIEKTAEVVARTR